MGQRGHWSQGSGGGRGGRGGGTGGSGALVACKRRYANQGTVMLHGKVKNKSASLIMASSGASEVTGTERGGGRTGKGEGRKIEKGEGRKTGRGGGGKTGKGKGGRRERGRGG